MALKQESNSSSSDKEEDLAYSLNLEWHRLKYLLHQKASALTSALVALDAADTAHQDAMKQVEIHETLMAETLTRSLLPEPIPVVSQASTQPEETQSPSKVSFEPYQQRQTASEAEHVVEQARGHVQGSSAMMEARHLP